MAKKALETVIKDIELLKMPKTEDPYPRSIQQKSNINLADMSRFYRVYRHYPIFPTLLKKFDSGGKYDPSIYKPRRKISLLPKSRQSLL